MNQDPNNSPSDAPLDTVCTLLRLLGDTGRELDRVQAETDSIVVGVTDSRRSRFVHLQAALAEAEAELEKLCRRHRRRLFPEGKKTVKTPVGTVAMRTTERLEIADPALTIERIAGTVPDPDRFIRRVEEPNREALEALSDRDLVKLGVRRVREQSFTAKPLRVQLDARPVAGKEAAGA